MTVASATSQTSQSRRRRGCIAAAVCRDLLRSGVYPDLSKIPLLVALVTTGGQELIEEKDRGVDRGGAGGRKVDGMSGGRKNEA